jgi:hypothetical protein
MTDEANEQGVMPDFIFVRQRHIEAKEGSLLAGILVTPFSKGRKRLKRREAKSLRQALQKLSDQARSNRFGDEPVYIWSDGIKPSTPIADNVMERRAKSHAVVAVQMREDRQLRLAWGAYYLALTDHPALTVDVAPTKIELGRRKLLRARTQIGGAAPGDVRSDAPEVEKPVLVETPRVDAGPRLGLADLRRLARERKGVRVKTTHARD